MNVYSVSINNYKSIRDTELKIDPDENGKVFSLLGVNETGKTSILQAIDIAVNQKQLTYKNDCYKPAQDNDEKVEIEIELTLNSDDFMSISQLTLVERLEGESDISEPAPEENIDANQDNDDSPISIEENKFLYSYSVASDNSMDVKVYTYKEEYWHPLDEVRSEFILNRMPKVIFWRGRDDEIIPDVVPLAELSGEQNIPLANCLKISKLTPERVLETKGDGIDQEEISEKISEAVTKYINKKWPGHDVSIRFYITDERITCSILDSKNPERKRIPPSARSDGFKKMISFLMSMSVENEQAELKDSILLLDEPERFLHPEAQMHFRNELQQIASQYNNVVLYATHSMYMVNKNHTDKCYIITKRLLEDKSFQTDIERIESKKMSFAEINYVVFNIVSSDYHNELYGILHQRHIEESEDSSAWSVAHFDKNKLTKRGQKKLSWKRPNRGGGTTTENLTIHSYIRNSIHHPENNCENREYSEEELKKSIEFLRSLKMK